MKRLIICQSLIMFLFMHCQAFSQVHLPSAERITVSAVRQLTSGDYYMNPVFSPDGELIAFSKEGYNGILIARKDGSEKKLLVPDEGSGYKFSWSVDSQNIAFRMTKAVDGKRLGAIGVANVESARSQSLTVLIRGIRPPTWTYLKQDGEQQTALAGKTSRKQVLYSVHGEIRSADFSNSAPVSHDDLVGQPALRSQLSHAKILFQKDDNIFLKDETGKEVQLTSDMGIDPVWSPDRSMIVYSEWDNLIVMNADGSQKRNLGYGINPSWSPDGQKLVYQVTYDDGYAITQSDLYLINIDGGQKIQLTKTPDEFEVEPNWSPDGSEIVYSSAITGSIFKAILQW